MACGPANTSPLADQRPHRPELEEDDSVNGTHGVWRTGGLLSSQFSVNLKLS